MPGSHLRFLLCLLSATILITTSSSSRTNRKPEATPGKFFASTDDVISGSSSPKQNGIVPLLMAAGSVERNEEGSKTDTEERLGTDGMDRLWNAEDLDEFTAEGVNGVGPLSAEGSKVAAVLNDVVENLASLRDLVNSLKFQNHVIYRQMKKMRTKYCSSRSQNRMQDEQPSPPPPPPPSSDQQSLQQDGRYNSRDEHFSNVPGPVSAALRVEKDSGSEAGGGSAAAEDGAVCPHQFSYSAETGRCYRLSGDRMTWKMARERCRWMKGSLASIDSAKEQRVINDMARAKPATQHCDFWIGLTRQGPMSTTDWFWDGDGHLPSFSNWNDGEPNNGNGDEQCTQMLWVFNWRWNDAPCSHGNACFACETRPKGQ